MAITVGLDFGTHQTKLCIENSDDPNHKTYEFWDWGNQTYALPSVIQINKNHTLSYGKIDMDQTLVCRKKKHIANPGVLVLPKAPQSPTLSEVEEPVLPSMPIYEYISEEGLPIKLPLRDLYGIGKPLPSTSKPEDPIKTWKKERSNLVQEYKRKFTLWKKVGKAIGMQMPTPPELPPKPKQSIIPSVNDEDIKGINPHLIATPAQIAEYNKWKKDCDFLLSTYKKTLALNEEKQNHYLHQLRLWEKECQELQDKYNQRVQQYQESLIEYPMVFRYFKQATFSLYRWNYEIEARDLSVLYLAYIIFKLEERFGKNFSIQMGIPASEITFKRYKPFATGLLIQAIRLVEDVFANDFNKFMSTPYDDLLKLIPSFEYSDELKYEYGIMIIPEAYAALRSVTANGRISPGMSILLDIGGGTTDISFFVIEENGEPHVYHYESITKGLNYFLEYEETAVGDISYKRELEELSQSTFSNAYHAYKLQIEQIVNSLIGFLHTDTITRGFSKHIFSDAIINRPVIYSGGGSYDIRMRKTLLHFTQVIHLNKNILRIPNVIKEPLVNIPYSILATSYGLSISMVSDDLKISNKEDLFAKYSKKENDRWSAYQEHGMYED